MTGWLKEKFTSEVASGAGQAVRLLLSDGDSQGGQGRRQHGRGRGRGRSQAPGPGGGGTGGDRGPAPAIRRAKKSIANFKLREGMPIGCTATLHGRRMYEFLGRLLNLALPRVRDFRGCLAQGVRRSRELHAGHSRASDLPRAERIQGPEGQGHECLHRDHRAHRRGSAFEPARRPGDALPVSDELIDCQPELPAGRWRRSVATTAWMAKARKKPKFPVRQRNRCQRCGGRGFSAQVPPVPDLLPGPGARRPVAGRDQGELVDSRSAER